jgi:hypothetical protein
MNQPTQFQLRLQLLSYDLSPQVLKLLRIGKYELSHRDGFRACLFAKNRRERLPVAVTDLEDLPDTKFNSITVSSSGERGRFRMMLEVSPNNALWADTRNAGGASPKEELIRAGFESLQVRVARLGIKNYPTVLDCFVSLEQPSNGDSYQAALDWTVASFVSAELGVACIGAADLLKGVAGETWSSIANSLDGAPGGADQNRGKFDRMHDIMVCPLSVGERVANYLTNEAVHIVQIKGAHPLALVCILPGAELRHDAERMPDFLVPAIERPVVHGPSNYAIYSKREYKELDARGMVPRLNWDEVLHPIFDSEHGGVLGIEAEEMIVLPMHKMMANQIERQAAEALTQRDITTENIFDLYEQIYNQHFNSDYMHRVFDRLRGLRAVKRSCKKLIRDTSVDGIDPA